MEENHNLVTWKPIVLRAYSISMTLNNFPRTHHIVKSYKTCKKTRGPNSVGDLRHGFDNGLPFFDNYYIHVIFYSEQKYGTRVK